MAKTGLKWVGGVVIVIVIFLAGAIWGGYTVEQWNKGVQLNGEERDT